jgi:hypothetical protein
MLFCFQTVDRLSLYLFRLWSRLCVALAWISIWSLYNSPSASLVNRWSCCTMWSFQMTFLWKTWVSILQFDWYVCYNAMTDRCKLLTCLDERLLDSTRYWYPQNRETAWRPHSCRQLKDLVLPLIDIDQEEQQRIRRNMAKCIGFIGTSILHRRHSLCGFDVTKDCVIDLQHGLSSNPLTHDFEALLVIIKDSDDDYDSESRSVDMVQDISDQLNCMPWTSGKWWFFSVGGLGALHVTYHAQYQLDVNIRPIVGCFSHRRRMSRVHNTISRTTEECFSVLSDILSFFIAFFIQNSKESKSYGILER